MSSVSVVMSCDGLFSSFIGLSIPPNARLQTITHFWAVKLQNAVNDKSSVQLTNSAFCQQCLPTTCTCSASCSRLSCVAFLPCLRWSRIHVNLFCYLIGATRFLAHSLPPCCLLPGSLFFVRNESTGTRLAFTTEGMISCWTLYMYNVPSAELQSHLHV